MCRAAVEIYLTTLYGNAVLVTVSDFLNTLTVAVAHDYLILPLCGIGILQNFNSSHFLVLDRLDQGFHLNLNEVGGVVMRSDY